MREVNLSGYLSQMEYNLVNIWCLLGKKIRLKEKWVRQGRQRRTFRFETWELETSLCIRRLDLMGDFIFSFIFFSHKPRLLSKEKARSNFNKHATNSIPNPKAHPIPHHVMYDHTCTCTCKPIPNCSPKLLFFFSSPMHPKMLFFLTCSPQIFSLTCSTCHHLLFWSSFLSSPSFFFFLLLVKVATLKLSFILRLIMQLEM